MKITYTIKKPLQGAQQLVAAIIALSPTQQLTVNEIFEQLKTKLEGYELYALKRGSVLRHVQELEYKNVVSISGKSGKSFIYAINPACVEKSNTKTEN